jgi:hypothetical protein
VWLVFGIIPRRFDQGGAFEQLYGFRELHHGHFQRNPKWLQCLDGSHVDAFHRRRNAQFERLLETALFEMAIK